MPFPEAPPTDAAPAPRDPSAFAPINRAYGDVFRPGELTLGLVVPIEEYASSRAPSMRRHLERVQLAESLGFCAVWLRDVPFDVPSFGDTGQVFDPFVYLGMLAASTDDIALGVSSIVLPLRHPAHVAKAAASADVLSDGRLLLGVASGDRPDEYPAMGVAPDERGARFRAAYDYLRAVETERPAFDNPFGSVRGGIDLLPKPTAGRIPMLITGSSSQDERWVATHGDGWMTYPRPGASQAAQIERYRTLVAEEGRFDKPVLQPLYIDLVDHPMPHGPEPIHLGLRLDISQLQAYLEQAREAGVNHLALNLRFNEADVETTLRRLADEVLPDIPTTRNATP
ncbi:MAG: TIGR03571 family LLM class oxidoreductase [Actinomycetota bacterium]